MRRYALTESAADDLDEIWVNLAEHRGDTVADLTLRHLIEAFGDLAERPGIGHLRSDRTDLPLHFHQVRPYLVMYQRNRFPLLIHAVLHTSRDVPSLLRSRPKA